MNTIYIKKSNLSVVQEYPVPDVLSDWHVAEVSSPVDYVGKVFNPATSLFEYPPVEVPTVVTRRQARRAMEQAGVLQAVEAYISTLDMASQIDYADASEFERSNPLIAQAKIALGWSDEALDSLFTLAGSI